MDHLVSQAKNIAPGIILPMVNITISEDGFTFTEVIGKKGLSKTFTVDIISYGVQDLVYTRVFSMIVVVDETLKSGKWRKKLLENRFKFVISEAPFLCYSFVCDSRDQARKITFALAAVFQHYGKKIKEESKETGKVLKRLAIDLRSPEEQAENGMDDETDAWFIVFPL